MSNSSQSNGLQASLSLNISQSLPKFISIESVMPSNHLILCCPLLLLPSIFPNIRVFSNESIVHIRWPNYWSFNFSISPSKEYSGATQVMLVVRTLMPLQEMQNMWVWSLVGKIPWRRSWQLTPESYGMHTCSLILSCRHRHSQPLQSCPHGMLSSSIALTWILKFFKSKTTHVTIYCYCN